MRSLQSEIQQHFELALEKSGQFEVEELEETVHSIRKSCKRIRAYLRLTRHPKSEQCESTCDFVRNAANLLSSIRDAHVVPKAAARIQQQLVPTGFLSFDALSLREIVAAIANEQAGSLGLQQERFQSAHAQLQNAYSQFQTGGINATKSSLRRGLRRSYYRARYATLQALSSSDVEQMHDLRKASKRFGYQCELAADLLGLDLQSQAQTSQTLSDRIGDALDVQVLLRVFERTLTDDGNTLQSSNFIVQVEKQRDTLIAAAMPIACQAYFRTARQFNEDTLVQRV